MAKPIIPAYRSGLPERDLGRYSAFTELQPELLELAQGYVERVILERSIARINSCPRISRP